MIFFVKHSRRIRFITFMIPIFLVFMGVRVPDLSRPHRPKSMRSAVLDKTSAHTVLKSIVTIHVVPCITNPPALVLPATVEYFPEVPIIQSAK
jgi:hypothetical protein